MKLESYVGGRWVKGRGVGRDLVNPTNGAILGQVDATGIDPHAALAHARDTGGPALRALTFAERGDLLRQIADVLSANRAEYGEIARLNSGNTGVDASIDIDGAIGTLKVYARIGKSLGDARLIMEPGHEALSRDGGFGAGHILTSRTGAALHINAFNFPAWGLWEKVAVALLSGVGAVAKPASATAWLSHQMVRHVVEAGVLPQGALSLVCGAGEELLDALQPFDHLAFTGSSDTAARLRAHPNVLAAAPRINIEADSVNATILGPDARPGTAVFDLLVQEAGKALSVKAGQLCTNIRRVFVPAPLLDAVRDALAARIDEISVGDPAEEGVSLGPLVNARQQHAALHGLSRLTEEARVVRGGGVPDRLTGGDRERGAFVAATLLVCEHPDQARFVHEMEVFGPVLTVMPYEAQADAAALAARGGGSLVASVFTNDAEFAAGIAGDIAPCHGRVLIVDESVGKAHTGHAIVMPQCVHGGPGRAGNGQELGGLRGLGFYMQRTAVQGSPVILERLRSMAAEGTV